jgi:DNA-binding SARP family transcriptional activator
MDTYPVTLARAHSPDPVLSRPRLFKPLDRLRQKSLIWVGGGPGAGKTMLVASYLVERRLEAQWYRGSRIDGRSLRELVQGLKPGAVLVLDDCEAYGPASPLHPGLIEVSPEIPPQSNVILIGRGEPPGIYARLIANDSMAVLQGHELSFSLEETRTLARQVSLDGPRIDALHSVCAGWAAGIAIGLRALRRPLANAEGWGRELRSGAFNYFASEVFAAISPRERQILVATALLPRVSAAQAQALSGTSEAWSYLNRFEREQNFLLLTGSPQDEMLHYVPVFRQFVLDRLEITFDAKELHALAERATALLEMSPTLPWLGGCDELLGSLAALRSGDRLECHRLLRVALSEEARTRSELSRACLVFPTALAQLCNEAISADIAADSARHLVHRYRLPAPPDPVKEWPWPFRVFLLGRFHLLRADMPIRFSRRAQRKPLELLQALIAFGGTEVGAGVLADALWPDAEGDAGYHSLESALYRLRRLLGAPDTVSMVNGRLSLDRRQFWVDVWELERELQGGQSDTDLLARLLRARQLYHGHFLEHEIEKNWALQRRQAIRTQYLGCLRDAARTYESQRLWREAASVYQSGLDLDMLAEDLYRGLMVCHWQLGEHSEAVRAYRRCRELLMRFLGAPPSERTEATYQTVRQSPSSTSPPVAPSSLPGARLPG